MVFELDTKDMERHSVELRLFVEKAKRRFDKAKMSDEYEKIIKNLLPQVDEHEENVIKIDYVDRQEARRLGNFLEKVVEKCQRVEQHEAVQSALRLSLQQSRRKSILDPHSGSLMEPMCLFCASSISSELPQSADHQCNANPVSDPLGQVQLVLTPIDYNQAYNAQPYNVGQAENPVPPPPASTAAPSGAPSSITPPQSCGALTPEVPLASAANTRENSPQNNSPEAAGRSAPGSQTTNASDRRHEEMTSQPTSQPASQPEQQQNHDKVPLDLSREAESEQAQTAEEAEPIKEATNEAPTINGQRNGVEEELVLEGNGMSAKASEREEVEPRNHEDSLSEWFIDSQYQSSTPLKRSATPSSESESELESELDKAKKVENKKFASFLPPTKEQKTPLALKIKRTLRNGSNGPAVSSKQLSQRSFPISPSTSRSSITPSSLNKPINTSLAIPIPPVTSHSERIKRALLIPPQPVPSEVRANLRQTASRCEPVERSNGNNKRASVRFSNQEEQQAGRRGRGRPRTKVTAKRRGL